MNTKLFFIALQIFIIAGCYGQIIHVPADQPNIQSGINVATDGDTVLVANGTYYENINFVGKAITVASHFVIDGDEGHIDNTIIDGSQPISTDTASVVAFISGEDTTSVICGFTITGGSGLWISMWQAWAGGGIGCFGSGAKILHNIIVENSVTSNVQAIGGGIACLATSGSRWLVIKDNTISNNSTESLQLNALGGGLYTGINTRLSNNTIENNTTICTNGEALGGGVCCFSIYDLGETLYFHNNLVRNNTLEGHILQGAGVFGYKFNALLSGNTFSQNTCITQNDWWGAGVNFTEPRDQLTVMNNEFSYNSGPLLNNSAPGGGLLVKEAFEAKVTIDGNIFSHNTGSIGGGFYARSTYNLTLTNNLFSENQTARGAGIGLFHYEDKSDYSAGLKGASLPVIANNTFFNNHSDQTGGGIFLTGSAGEGLITFNNIFWENEALVNGNDIFNNATNLTIYVFKSNIDGADIYGLWSGGENINQDPLFIDDSCHIDNYASPCINAGIDILEINGDVYNCPLIDFENESRPLPIGHMPDMGADEVDETVGYTEFNHKRSRFEVRCFPNPFVSSTTIQFTLPKAGYAKLQLYCITGIKIHSLYSGMLQAGENSSVLNANGMPEGMYLLRLETDGVSECRKLLLVK